MRILLVDPPNDSDGYNDFRPFEECFYPPLWALCLATYLKNKIPKAEIYILDGQISEISEILTKLRSFNPAVVGIGPMWINYKNALVIARQAKKYGSRVAMGGHHATGLAKEILLNRGICSDDYCVDAVIRSDGEEAFYQYVIGRPLRQINNLVYQDPKSGLIKSNPIKLLNLDSLPIPDRNMVDIDNYFGIEDREYHGRPPERKLFMYSKKGCRWRSISQGGCIFCARMYEELLVRDPSLVLNEIDYLVKNFNVNFLWDVSDNFFDGEGWFEKFYNLYKNYTPKPLMRIYARADSINKEIARKLNDLQIKKIILGLESGSPRSLASLHKGSTVKINKDAIQFLASAGITSLGFFVFGAPNESSESLKISADFLYQLNKLGMNRFWTHILEPFPNSLAFRLLQKKAGDKYKNNDLFDNYEAMNDWVSLFCQVSFSEILAFRRKLEFLPNSGY